MTSYTKNGIPILPHHNRRIHKLIQKIRKSGTYARWQQAVLKRDHNKCTRCGNIEEITAHHKTELSEIFTKHRVRTLPQALHCNELWDLDNGETLCLECHRKEHNLISHEVEDLDVEATVSGRSG